MESRFMGVLCEYVWEDSRELSPEGWGWQVHTLERDKTTLCARPQGGRGLAGLAVGNARQVIEGRWVASREP